MDTTHAFETINFATFTDLLKQYPDVVPEKLTDLDIQRYSIIPSNAKTRLEENDNDVYISKAELETLMKWKLTHGKFRPQLSKLIAENSESAVRETTSMAAKLFLSKTNSDTTPSQSDYKTAITTLTSLRGVGPATASLILSCLPDTKAPFFSDELYRWAFFSATGSGKGDVGWERKLKYSLVEYLDLVEKVVELKERLGRQGVIVTSVEIEKVAYVIGKRASGLAEASQKDGREKKRKEGPASSPSEKKAAPRSSSKRPKTETQIMQSSEKQAEEPRATRRSTRNK
ncbi:Hypothetical protein R9X50_00351500 [Acrodontium crateriforme]|uniref:Uncharacterized protein n=1 Tax=Acrodontium crateriforme TaxID=150365 RepID=A0AAQ3M3J6_9PEZI|nr:Hypothetical protein R9X50_00351500 [Acrodontium crateriforme]